MCCCWDRSGTCYSLGQYILGTAFHVSSNMGYAGKLVYHLGTTIPVLCQVLRSIASPGKTCKQNSQTCLKNSNYLTCFCRACNADETWNQNGTKYHICMKIYKFLSSRNVISYRFHTSCKYGIEPNQCILNVILLM